MAKVTSHARCPQRRHSVNPAHAHCSPNHNLRAHMHAVQICVPCSIYCCRHARASSWHAVEHASSWLLLCYKHQAALLFVSGCLNAVHHASIWLNAVHSTSMGQYRCIMHAWLWCYASIAQCYQASICSSLLCIRHQYSCASCMNNMVQCCGSGINMAQCSASGINMAQSWHSVLCIRHQCGCASYINMARCYASTAQWCASGIIMAKYGSMLCSHQFMAWWCASGTTMWLKPVHYVSIKLDQYGSIHCKNWWLFQTRGGLLQYPSCSLQVY